MIDGYAELRSQVQKFQNPTRARGVAMRLGGFLQDDLGVSSPLGETSQFLI